VPAARVLELVRSDPFEGVGFTKDQRGWVAALAARPKKVPELPVVRPAGRSWSVRMDRAETPFALGLWRRRPGGFEFPNTIVESALGVPATTRFWETLVRVAELLE
jgi:hypothetical protein